MLLRIISALIPLPFILWLIWTGGWPFAALILVVAGICLYEAAAMTVPGDRVAAVVLMIAGLGLVLAVLTGAFMHPIGAAVPALLFVGLLLFFLFRPGELETAHHRMGGAVLALCWGGLLVAMIGVLSRLPEGGAWVLLACVLSWGSDTGAYFAGRFLGKKKLYEKVSPKKTWAGAVGGVLSATAMAYVFWRFLGPSTLPLPALLLLSPIGAALGQLGDLAESLLKRAAGVKDSGKIMPGHGGLLDRIDALVFVAPWLLSYAVGILGLPLTWLTL
ncbi:MAG: phosphatidate cytidylyltransferase [Myxococcota bacterium]